MNLAEQRRAIRHLLDENSVADAMDAYFAFYHPDSKTTLYLFPSGALRASAYIALSQTGMDLFRPLLTMRLPIDDAPASTEMLYQALQPGVGVIISAPEAYAPLIRALFAVHVEEVLRQYILEPNRFRPITNVLVTQDVGANGLPRFLIRNRQADNVLVASAGLNWQSPRYAEISVNTHPGYRRQGYGRSVVAAMVSYLLANGRIPLYVSSEANAASIQLAERVGFAATGSRQLMIHGQLKPPPDLGR